MFEIDLKCSENKLVKILEKYVDEQNDIYRAKYFKWRLVKKDGCYKVYGCTYKSFYIKTLNVYIEKLNDGIRVKAFSKFINTYIKFIIVISAIFSTLCFLKDENIILLFATFIITFGCTFLLSFLISVIMNVEGNVKDYIMDELGIEND